jgi:hypothetical protein
MACVRTQFVLVYSLCLNEENYRNEMPSDVRPCVVAQDCVVSQWSAWIRTQDGCVAASGKASSRIYDICLFKWVAELCYGSKQISHTVIFM